MTLRLIEDDLPSLPGQRWTPRRMLATLVGQMEIGIGEGTTRRFGPGDVVLADDLTGQGHNAFVGSSADQCHCGGGRLTRVLPPIHV
jgi:hypothetical protein